MPGPPATFANEGYRREGYGIYRTLQRKRGGRFLGSFLLRSRTSRTSRASIYGAQVARAILTETSPQVIESPRQATTEPYRQEVEGNRGHGRVHVVHPGRESSSECDREWLRVRASRRLG